MACAMDRPTLVICAAVVAASAATALTVASAAPAEWRRLPTQTKAEAERNVLRALPQRLNHTSRRWFLDGVTGLLKNNVQVICSGRGTRFSHGEYRRFRCLVRAYPKPKRRGLIVTYRASAPRNLRVHRLKVGL